MDRRTGSEAWMITCECKIFNQCDTLNDSEREEKGREQDLNPCHPY